MLILILGNGVGFSYGDGLVFRRLSEGHEYSRCQALSVRWYVCFLMRWAPLCLSVCLPTQLTAFAIIVISLHYALRFISKTFCLRESMLLINTNKDLVLPCNVFGIWAFLQNGNIEHGLTCLENVNLYSIIFVWMYQMYFLMKMNFVKHI